MGFSITDLMTKTSKEDMHNNAEAQLQKATFRDIRVNIESKIKLMARNMVQIGYYLKLLRDKELYKEAGYDNFLECAFKEFNLTESSVYRFIKANNEYSMNGNSLEVDTRYSEYNSSQLIEMINMPEEQRAGITPDMPVKEIRQLKKASAETDKVKVKDINTANPDEGIDENIISEVLGNTSDSSKDDEEAITVDGVEVSTGCAMPVFESIDQRFAFIDDYELWPVWLDIKETGEKYYRYELPNGDAIVVKDYLYHDGTDTVEAVRGKAEYCLMQEGKTFKDGESSRVMIVNYLKDI